MRKFVRCILGLSVLASLALPAIPAQAEQGRALSWVNNCDEDPCQNTQGACTLSANSPTPVFQGTWKLRQDSVITCTKIDGKYPKKLHLGNNFLYRYECNHTSSGMRCPGPGGTQIGDPWQRWCGYANDIFTQHADSGSCQPESDGGYSAVGLSWNYDVKEEPDMANCFAFQQVANGTWTQFAASQPISLHERDTIGQLWGNDDPVAPQHCTGKYPPGV